MTEMELLQYIGEADDRYILESRRRPKPRRAFPWVRAAAACLAAVLVGTAGFTVLRHSRQGVMSTAETVQEAEGAAPAAENGWITEEEEAAEEADMAYAGDGTDYGGILLASAEYPAAIALDDYEARSLNWQENQTTPETKSALNAFAYATAAAVLRDGTESGAYSPLSLYQTLAVLASGADGQTREQLLSLLGQSDLETLADQSGKLYRVNYADNQVDALQIANSLWLDGTDASGTPVDYRQDWVMSAARDYYADVFQAEFEDSATAEALGLWIAEHTGNLLRPSPEALDFDPNTVMAIVNTLYYKSQWQNELSESATAPGDFLRADGTTVPADFMHTTEEGGAYIQTDAYTKSYLNLHRGKMIFVLPEEGVSVDDLLTEERLWEIFENGDYGFAQVQWSIPKFSSDADYDLGETLQSLGVTDAFSPELADFSTISDSPLYLGRVRQGTHIGVDEEGVEAAAFSMAEAMAGEGMPDEDPTVIEMNLNRPFLYLITADDGSTLFLGVVRDPG